MRRIVKLVIGLLLVLSGCASNSGVVPIGNDTYKIYKRGATGFSGSDAVKSEVMIQASEYCATKNKTVQVVNVILGSPPYIFGNFPKAEVQFQCVDPNAVVQSQASKAAPAAVVQSDKYDQLKKLRTLLDDKTITKEEFEIQKKQILAK
jgi:hypothetical protein